jgi:signal transduction histidine kinase
MRLRRVGLVLATVLVLLAVVPAFIIEPDPSTGRIGELSVVVAIISAAIAVATVVLLIPAWRGGRRSALAIAASQALAIIPAIPAFVLPADVVPVDGVVLAAIGVLLSAAAIVLIVLGLSTAFVYAAGVVVVIAVYAALVAIASALVPESAGRAVQTGAAIAVALGFLPLVALLSRAASRVLYGTRDDPERTLRRVGRTVPAGSDTMAAAVADTAQALRLPRLELRDGDHVLAAAGTASAPTVASVAIDDRLSLHAALRPGERRLHGADRAALELVALPLALLVRQARLTDELTSARAAAATVRERERAKLHRDLHDGLGPLLTGAALRADAARNLLSGEQPAGEQLDIVRAEVREAIGEVRRVVDGLRPLDLEQQGLWAFVEKRAARAGAQVALPDERPEVSDATALAVHRIVGEAIANAERHAPGQPISLTMAWSAGGDLEIRVANAGAPGVLSPGGVGIGSMRARAEELGGSFEAGPGVDGWTVRVTLPPG